MPNTNEEFLDLTGLGYFKDRLDTEFPSKTAFDALEDKVDEIISEGGEPNVIEVVKVNNTPLTPDANKAVNVEVPEDLSDLTNAGADPFAKESDIPTKVSDLTDSADYAKKTDLVGFVTSSDITTQDTDYVMTTTGWKVLTLPGGGMTQVIHDTTLTGQGNDNNSKLGVAWSALSSNTIDYSNSAFNTF